MTRKRSHIYTWFSIVVVGLATLACERNVMPKKGEHGLPVVDLEIDEKYLWSADSGLYVVGNDENYQYKWEHPARVKYKQGGETHFSDSVGFRIKGRSTRDNNMKSLGLYWRSEYGKSKLEYPVFEDNSITTYKRILLRNLANDPLQTYIKDAAITAMYKDYANVDFQAYEPCVLYINDEYWGLYGLREMITPHHFEFHYGANRDSVDLITGYELSPIADDGSTVAYMSEIVDFINKNDLAVDSNYATLSQRMDMVSYMDYIVVNTYMAKHDWPGSNGKWWKERSAATTNKWRWVVYDADLGFSLAHVDDLFMGELYGESFGMMGDKDGFFILNHLIKNKEFKAAFLNRYLYFIDEVFTKDRVEKIIKDTYAEIENEYQYHQDKWNSPEKITLDLKAKGMIMFNNKRNRIVRDIIKGLQDEE